MRPAPLDMLAGWRAARAAGLVPGVPGAAAPPGTLPAPQNTADVPGVPGGPGDAGTDRAEPPEAAEHAATAQHGAPPASPEQEDWTAVDAWLRGGPENDLMPKEDRE